MSMSIGVITGFVALGGLGIGYYLINSKNNTKNNKSEKEIIVPYTRPARERIQFTKVSTDIKSTPIATSNIKRNSTPSRSSNTTRNHNTYVDDDFYPIYHDYGSSYHSSSHDSHSSYDSGGCDSGSCDCDCGCD